MIAARTALTATAALLLVGIPAPFAAAGDATPAPGGTAAASAQPPAESEQTKAIRAALQQAEDTGRPVRIDAMTTETTEVFADTDGRTLYSDARSQDVRTRRNGTWQTLDATLKANADGTVTPAVTSSDLVLSGGGSGPLATITTADGTSMAISAPFPLPKPTLEGATATYASVLPDVDLQVTARPDGGWRDVIVVKTAQAAADPRLKALHFPLSTSGLKVGADAAGNVSFKDAAGTVRFHAPTPFQWDSRTAPAPAPQVKPNAAQPKSLFAAPGAAEAAAKAAAKAAAEADTSNATRPGASAAVAAIGVFAGDTELVLTPDQATFGKGTGPWYLDPETSVDNGRQVNAQVQENHPDTANVNTLSALGVGYCGYDNCTGYGRYRSYYQMSTPDGLFEGGGHGAATVNRATLFVDVVDASAPTTKSTINVYSAPAFQGTTTWNNQPCGTNGKMTGCTWVANADTTGTSQLAYDVKGWMQTIVNNKSPNWTIGLSAEDEYDKLLRHHLTANPHITTYYDIAPTIWWPRTTPTPGYVNDPTFGTQRNDCQTPGATYAWYAPGWVGANQYIYLNANAWSPIGASVTANFHIWDDNDGNWHQWPSAAGGSYGTVTAPVGGLADGHQYGWTAAVSDGSLASGTTGACYFRVDKTPPQVSVSSVDYPASGQLNQAPTKKVGQPGTFVVNASDPAPANGLNASGVACVRWSTDPTAVTGWTCNDPTTAGSGIVSGTGFTFTPTVWGTNVLYVQGMDVAGNYSQPMRYTFYVPWDPAKGTASPGDLTGDGRGDILLPDEQGNLRVATLDSDAGSALAAPLELFPGAVGWKDSTTKITHRGALRSMPLDDTFARSTANADLGKNLYLFENNGDGTFKSASPLAKPSSWAAVDGTPLTTAPAGWLPDWSTAWQILALGPLNGPVNASDSLVMKNQTALLAMENGNLWLYRGDTTNTLDAPAIKVSDLNWGNYDLINPGPAAGNTANQPTLWSRNRSDGTIRAYDITLNNGRIDLSALADPAGPLSRVVGTQKFTPGSYPKIGSSGDANKDGIPDLWTLAPDGRLQVWPGSTVDGTKATAVNAFGGTAADQGNAAGFAERYRLQGLDVNTLVPGYYKTSPAARPIGNVSFPTDTVNGVSTKVAAFAGNSSLGRIDFSNLVGPFQVDTAKSFTITAWAKPNDANAQGAVLSSRGTNSSGFVLAPGTDGNWHFKLATADGTQAAYDDTASSMTNAARFQGGRWDRLTVSYNVTTKVMSLYVNGALAGTAVHSGGFAVKGQLEIGTQQEAAAFSTAFSGRISDVTVYNTPTDAGSGNGQLLLDTASNSCVDDPGSLNQVGQLLQISTCDGRNAQKYDAQPDGTIKVFTHCIEGVNNGIVNGTNVQLADCTGAPNQQWIFRPDGSIYNVLAQRCLDVPNANTTNGTLLQLYDCNQTTAQRWRTTPVA